MYDNGGGCGMIGGLRGGEEVAWGFKSYETNIWQEIVSSRHSHVS